MCGHSGGQTLYLVHNGLTAGPPGKCLALKKTLIVM